MTRFYGTRNGKWGISVKRNKIDWHGKKSAYWVSCSRLFRLKKISTNSLRIVYKKLPVPVSPAYLEFYIYLTYNHRHGCGLWRVCKLINTNDVHVWTIREILIVLIITISVGKVKKKYECLQRWSFYDSLDSLHLYCLLSCPYLQCY